MDGFILLIIVNLVSFLIGNAIGYNQGYNECEEIAQKAIYQIIEECEEKKVHEFQKANNIEREEHGY